VLSLLIVIGVTLVFVEIEVAVRSAIDTEFDGRVRHLSSVFDLGA